MKIQITTPKGVIFTRDEAKTAEQGTNLWTSDLGEDLFFTTRMFWDFALIVEQGANIDKLVADAVMYCEICELCSSHTHTHKAADGETFYIAVSK